MTIKTKDLRPCDNCGGPIAPFFYRLKISFRQLGIDPAAVNQVLGTAQIFGGNLALGSLMSPDSDTATEMPGYQIDTDLFLCSNCVLGMAGKEPYSLRPVDLMIDDEREGAS